MDQNLAVQVTDWHWQPVIQQIKSTISFILAEIYIAWQISQHVYVVDEGDADDVLSWWLDHDSVKNVQHVPLYHNCVFC